MSSPFDLTGGPLPAWAERRFVVIEPGCSLPYEQAQWRGALVVVASGEVDLACTAGGRRRFGEGSLIPLEILPLLTLENPGCDPTVLVAISRGTGAGRATATS